MRNLSFRYFYNWNKNDKGYIFPKNFYLIKDLEVKKRIFSEI